ncbi:hypothetical protein SAMN05661012_04515 [Chitinophaga sancti]|uniref:Uncharacterized protein n=1 Tax=Chitinophaga sancti TaxID=1004 RepID=A0A1K1S0Z8_9BACT|nr:hypothetical protein SAMN05661012_04515 [Chitinophaga sancti]
MFKSAIRKFFTLSGHPDNVKNGINKSGNAWLYHFLFDFVITMS